MILVAAVIGAAVHAAHSTLMSRLFAAGQVAAALGAIGAVGIFLWTRLRLDKAWKWLFRHIQEDKKESRMQEFLEAQAAPQVRELRKSEMLESIGPELQGLHSCVDRVGQKVEQIAARQVEVAADLTEAKQEVKRVAERLQTSEAKRDKEALVVIEHISDDARFQEKVMPILETQQAFQEYMVEGKAFMAGFKAADHEG